MPSFVKNSKRLLKNLQKYDRELLVFAAPCTLGQEGSITWMLKRYGYPTRHRPTLNSRELFPCPLIALSRDALSRRYSCVDDTCWGLRQRTCVRVRGSAQNPLHTFPRNFSVDGEAANLLRTC